MRIYSGHGLGKIFKNKTQEELSIRKILINLINIGKFTKTKNNCSLEGVNMREKIQTSKISAIYLSDKVFLYEIYKQY